MFPGSFATHKGAGSKIEHDLKRNLVIQTGIASESWWGGFTASAPSNSIKQIVNPLVILRALVNPGLDCLYLLLI